MKNILIISPHTDDAELGSGGSIIKFIEENMNLLWVVLSTAEVSVPENLPKNTLKTEFVKIIEELNLNEKNYVIKNYKVRYLHQKRQDILDLFVSLNKKFKPDLVIGPSLKDIHQDHIIVANEMVRAFKSYASIISYELPWNHITFETQFFIKLEQRHVMKKIGLLKNYRSQILLNRQYFENEFIYGLAKVRGSQINHEFAEAFEVIRWIY